MNDDSRDCCERVLQRSVILRISKAFCDARNVLGLTHKLLTLGMTAALGGLRATHLIVAQSLPCLAGKISSLALGEPPVACRPVLLCPSHHAIPGRLFAKICSASLFITVDCPLHFAGRVLAHATLSTRTELACIPKLRVQTRRGFAWWRSWRSWRSRHLFFFLFCSRLEKKFT